MENDFSDLMKELHGAAQEVSYFQAAEGSDYTREADARKVAWGRWVALKEIAMKHGVFDPEDFKNYLV